jgi:hypothetical protein
LRPLRTLTFETKSFFINFPSYGWYLRKEYIKGRIPFYGNRSNCGASCGCWCRPCFLFPSPTPFSCQPTLLLPYNKPRLGFGASLSGVGPIGLRHNVPHCSSEMLEICGDAFGGCLKYPSLQDVGLLWFHGTKVLAELTNVLRSRRLQVTRILGRKFSEQICYHNLWSQERIPLH